jgi:hypothetical protein
MARYDKYGNNDDRTLEDLDLGFKGYNNRLRPDQLQRGFLSSSVNGRLDLNGEWQVRKGISNIVSPFTVAGNAVRLPTTAEESTGTVLRLPFTVSAATVSANVVTITTGTIEHGFVVGDKVVIEGIKKASGADPDPPNGEQTITVVTATTFKFNFTTTATAFNVAEGIVLTWEAFPNNPITYGSASNYAELNDHLFLPHAGGSEELTLNDATNTEVTSSCRFSDNSVSTDEFVILSSVTNAVAVNVNTKTKFNMSFEEGETVPVASQLLQVLNKIILFRDEQAPLECKKFFPSRNIASATRPGGSRTVTVNTTVAHGLATGDFIGIENLDTGNEDPNGSFTITVSDVDTFTYQVANTSPSASADTYTAAEGSFGRVIPAFKKAPNGQYTQPIEVACNAGEYAQVENRGVVHKNPDNYQLGDELEFLGEANDTNVSGLIIGSRFNVSKVFEEGTNVAIQSTTNNGNTHGNAEYNALYQISVNSNGHGLSVGDPITISDIAPVGAASSLNGDWYVASVTDSDNFIIYITANASNATSGNVKVAEGFEFFLQSEKTNTHILEYESYLAQPVFSKKVALSMGYIHMPNPPYGIYHQKRLVVPFFYDVDANGLTTDRGNRDELIMSDLLDTDTYDEIFGQFRFNAGGADFNVGMHSFSEDVLVVFNRNSIHIVANSLNVQAALVKNLTDEVGCLARKSIIQVGNQILFLSDNGVYAINFQDEYNLRGNELPLSETISANIQNINKENAHKSTAVYFDNRYYIAVPMNYIKGVNTNQVFFTEREALEYVNPAGFGNTFDPNDSTKNLLERVQATENNVVLIYNFLNQSWESIDFVSDNSSNSGFAINEDWNILDLVVAGRGDARAVYVINSRGGVHKYDDGVLGDDSIITDIPIPGETSTPELKNIQGAATTRMYNLDDIDRKRFNNFELFAESSDDEPATFTLSAVAENIDSNFRLNTFNIAQTNEDVALRGRIGNKRAYGMQFKIQETLGRPKFKGLKVAASETFRSINKAE